MREVIGGIIRILLSVGHITILTIIAVNLAKIAKK